MAQQGEQLRVLAKVVAGSVVGDGGVIVSDVTHDSRRVSPGSLYVALRGHRADGHDFVAQAVAAGASAVCVEERTPAALPALVVPDTRAALGPLASEVHGRPSHDLQVVGVTGTNGKTTVTHFVESIAGSAGRETGLVGTIQTRIGDEAMDAGLTTPEASDFQRLLAMMRSRGVEVVAAEVSSHALELGRVRGTRFAVAAFTNLSQDHLDFHGDMSAYRDAKARLFRDYEVGMAVFNVADPVGADLARGYRGEHMTVGPGADVSADDVAATSSGTRLTLRTPAGSATVSPRITGDFNVANLTVAVACCLGLGMGLDEIVAGLGSVGGVPGRFEVVSGDDPITVVVDYAHTPEGVRTAVATGRTLTSGRVIGLIGAGGDRDRRKRPAMGEAIAAADVAIITSDNPRSEDPGAIVEEVVAGVPDGRSVLVEPDRRAAIDLALSSARDGDIVLILGRGHEKHQQVGGELFPFDDRIVAVEALTRLRGATGSAGRSGSMRT